MTFPPNTLSLPYTCADPSCACKHDSGGGVLQAHPRESDFGITVTITGDAGTVDEIHHHGSLNDALQLTHAEYPSARFNPEAA